MTSRASSTASSTGGALLGYPPFSHLVRIVVSGPEPDAPLQALLEVKEGLTGDLLGPAPLLRLRGSTARSSSRRPTSHAALAAQASRLLSAGAPAMRRAGLTAVVDVDPQSL